MQKSILVTGASSGIGEAVVRHLSSQGYIVVLVARNENKMKQLTEQLTNESLIIPYDLSNLDEIENIFKVCYENNIKLSGMVHCAGINQDLPIKANDIEVMKKITTVNYFSFVELGKYFQKKKYSTENASVVAISSSAAESCAKGMCTYASSKAAVNAAVKVMGKEFLKRRQRVNAIMPNFVDTPMARQMDNALGDLDEKVQYQPLGLIEPLHVAYLVEFLLSDKAAYITGACIPLSGGAIY